MGIHAPQWRDFSSIHDQRGISVRVKICACGELGPIGGSAVLFNPYIRMWKFNYCKCICWQYGPCFHRSCQIEAIFDRFYEATYRVYACRLGSFRLLFKRCADDPLAVWVSTGDVQCEFSAQGYTDVLTDTKGDLSF